MDWDNNSNSEYREQRLKKEKKKSTSKCLRISLLGLILLFAVVWCIIVFIRQEELNQRYDDMVEKMNYFETKQWKHDKLIEIHEQQHTMEYMKQNGKHIVLMPPHKLDNSLPVKEETNVLKKRQVPVDATSDQQAEEIITVQLSTQVTGNTESSPHASWSVEREMNSEGQEEYSMVFGFDEPEAEIAEQSEILAVQKDVLIAENHKRNVLSDKDDDNSDDDGEMSMSNSKPKFEPNELCTGDGCKGDFTYRALTFKRKASKRLIGVYNKNPTRTLDVNGDMIVRKDFKVCGPNIELCGKVDVTGSLFVNNVEITPPLQGDPGEDGINCWDLNQNGECDLPDEDVNNDEFCNVKDCKGPQGEPGTPGNDGAPGEDGINCWDLNQNGECDFDPDPSFSEDANDDGKCNVADCEGVQGDRGIPGTPGEDGINCWDLNQNRLCDKPSEDINNDNVCDVKDCQQVTCENNPENLFLIENSPFIFETDKCCGTFKIDIFTHVNYKFTLKANTEDPENVGCRRCIIFDNIINRATPYKVQLISLGSQPIIIYESDFGPNQFGKKYCAGFDQDLVVEFIPINSSPTISGHGRFFCDCEPVPENTECSQQQIDACPLPKPCHKTVCALIGEEPMCLDGLLLDNTDCLDNGICMQGMCVEEPTTTTTTPMPTSTPEQCLKNCFDGFSEPSAVTEDQLSIGCETVKRGICDDQNKCIYEESLTGSGSVSIDCMGTCSSRGDVCTCTKCFCTFVLEDGVGSGRENVFEGECK